MNLQKIKEQNKKNTKITDVTCTYYAIVEDVTIKSITINEGVIEGEERNIEWAYNILEVEDADGDIAYLKDKNIDRNIEVGKKYNICQCIEVYKTFGKTKATVVEVEKIEE